MQGAQPSSNHSLTLEGRSVATVTGVEDVDCFNEQIVVLLSLIHIYALSEHGVGDLQEARDVRACFKIALAAVLPGGAFDVVVDADHDVLELGVDFLERPGQALGILRHLQRGGRDAAGVGRLGGAEQHARVEERLNAWLLYTSRCV